MQFPKFIELLKPVEFLELLHCKRDRGCWKVGFSCGEGILVIDVPDDDEGRQDTISALRSVASAIEQDPAQQLALGLKASPPAEDRSGFLPTLTPESLSPPPKPQTELALPEPEPVTVFEEPLPGPPEPKPPAALSSIEDYFARKPRGRHPRPAMKRFDVDGGGVLEIPSTMVVSLWLDRDHLPPEAVDIAGLNELALAGKVRGAYAGSVIQAGWCLAWESERRVFVRAQARFPVTVKNPTSELSPTPPTPPEETAR